MKSMCKILLSLSICLAVTQSTLAGIGDIGWRGQERTTYQEWNFNNASNPAYPDKVVNPYQTQYNLVQAMITGKPTDTWEHFADYDGRKGVWFADELEIRLHILNADDPFIGPSGQPVPEENTFKDIVVQAIYQGNLEQPTVTAQANSIQPLAKNIYDLEDGWKKLEAVWRIKPNPSEEWVCLGLEGTGGAIDQIVVDTICVPEPATILLFGISGAFLKLKRRRAYPK